MRKHVTEEKENPRRNIYMAEALWDAAKRIALKVGYEEGASVSVSEVFRRAVIRDAKKHGIEVEE